MSYSFNVRAATKAAAIAMVAEKMAEVVASQPIHEADQAPVQAVAETFILLVRDDETQDISVSVNGTVSSYGVDTGLTSAGVGVADTLGLAHRTSESGLLRILYNPYAAERRRQRRRGRCGRGREACARKRHQLAWREHRQRQGEERDHPQRRHCGERCASFG